MKVPEVLTTTVARYLYAIPFGIFGVMHFMNASQMAGMVPIPGGQSWVYLVGVALIAACVSIIIEKYTKLACLLLALMLIIFVLSMHLPGVIGAADDGAMAASMSRLLKDTALAGGALILANNYDD